MYDDKNGFDGYLVSLICGKRTEGEFCEAPFEDVRDLKSTT